MKINVSVPNLRLFVGNIPKSKGKEEILDEFGKLTGNFKIRRKMQNQKKLYNPNIFIKFSRHFFEKCVSVIFIDDIFT